MDQDDLLRWLLGRSDGLRATMASSAGFLLTADVLVVAGLSYVSQAVWQEAKTLKLEPWVMLAQLIALAVAWGFLLFSVARALCAVAAANGFDVIDRPSRPTSEPLFRIDDEASADSKKLTELLRKDVEAASHYARTAKSSLHKSGFNLILVVLLIVVSYLVRASFINR
jgi:hypothetical protein